jgi:hypothetical protein
MQWYSPSNFSYSVVAEGTDILSDPSVAILKTSSRDKGFPFLYQACCTVEAWSTAQGRVTLDPAATILSIGSVLNDSVSTPLASRLVRAAVIRKPLQTAISPVV